MPAVNGRGSNAGIPSLKRKRQNEEEVLTVGAEVEIIKNFRKNENTAGLQSLMSNKVQSLLFASKSQAKESLTEDQSSSSFGALKDGLKTGVSLSASNLRKNIASSMQKIAPGTLRPTRSSGPVSEVDVLSAKVGVQNKAAVKKAALAGSVEVVKELGAAAGSNKVVASVEVHPVHVAGSRGKGNTNLAGKGNYTKLLFLIFALF